MLSGASSSICRGRRTPTRADGDPRLLGSSLVRVERLALVFRRVVPPVVIAAQHGILLPAWKGTPRAMRKPPTLRGKHLGEWDTLTKIRGKLARAPCDSAKEDGQIC